jgi:hypothetical protein
MWKAKCEYCGKDIEECVPCYPVYRKDGTKGYRHLSCYEQKTFALPDSEISKKYFGDSS